MGTKMPRLSESGIEYLDYSWGIFSGCKNQQKGMCSVKRCWAKGIALHFPKLYPNGFEPTFYPETVDSPKHLKKPSRIGVGWVGDVIGYGLEYKGQIYNTIQQCPHHTFLFLTKNSEKLKYWSPFPENCWVGVTATNARNVLRATDYLFGHKIAKIQFISIEPLLSWDSFKLAYPFCDSISKKDFDWIICGQQTPISAKTQPKKIWIEEIIGAAQKAGIPYFLKDNLRPIMGDNLVQEFPR